MSKKFDLEEYKKNIKVAETPLKKDKFIKLDECLQEVIGMPGFALGHITMCYGKQDSGKTSLMFHAAAKAQENDILPIMIVTEGKIDIERAKSMGFNPDNGIIVQSCEFLEDVFDLIDKITTDVAMGNLTKDVMIFWDSVGNTLSNREVEVKKDGTWEKQSTMMVASKVISERMRVISKKVNDTRKVTYPKAVGLFVINQAYTAPPKFPGGQSSLVPYGGSAILYRSSLILKTSKTKKLTAQKNGIKYGFGIISKISVEKNHLSSTTNSGEFVITTDSIIPNEANTLKEYKENNKDKWGNEFDIEESNEE